MPSEAIFHNTTVTGANPKALRAKLRKMGYSVRNATKNGDTYVFDCDAEGVASAPPQRYIIEPLPCVDIGDPPPRDTVEVIGKHLEPFDQIVGHFPITLTIDHEGIVMVSPPRPKTLPSNVPSHTYLGFHSLESGSISGYPIDTDKPYNVRRIRK